MKSLVLEKLKILVDKKVETLSKKPNFRKDPIGGKYAWSTSVISSAYKRHGAILEEAIVERLKEASHLDVIGFYWIKTNKKVDPEKMSKKSFFTGLGYWTRANPEQCLIATRGSPPRKAKNIPRVLISPRREHNRKPDEVYDLIKKLCNGPYLELFARKTQKGWDSWGKEKKLFDKGIISTRNRPSNMGRKNKIKKRIKKKINKKNQLSLNL